MNRFLAVIISLLASGCAAMHRPQASNAPPAHPEYVEASASALAFDPPIDEGAVHPEFARAPRQPSAFLGIDEPSSEIYLRATSDLQSNNLGDFYAQQSFSVKSGTRYR